MRLGPALTVAMLSSPATWAGEADVTDARIDCTANGCRISASVRHDDAGWDHYADRWEVLDGDGRVIATRVLTHPHVDEQPFTRHLDGVVLPPGLETVTIRAHDSVHGHGGKTVTLTVTAE